MFGLATRALQYLMADDPSLRLKGVIALLSFDPRLTNRRLAELLAIPVGKVAPLRTVATGVPSRRYRESREVLKDGMRFVPLCRPGQTQPNSVNREIDQLLAMGKKVSAIKVYRDAYGGDLQAAKLAVEHRMNGAAMPHSSGAATRH